MAQSTEKSELHRVTQFGMVGIVNTVIDFALFNLLLLFSVPAIVSSAISFLIANLNGYLMNRSWTFGDIKATKVLAQYGQYLLTGAVGLLINIGVVQLGTEYFNGTEGWLVANGSKLAAVILTVVWNYLTSRFFVFRKPTATN